MRTLSCIFGLPLIISCLLFSSCSKDNVAPDIEGIWIEIDSTTTQNPTGCELVIDKKEGEVTLCGFNMVHPKNVVSLFVRSDAKLFIKDGQMWYRQKKSDFLWVAPIARQDLYFIDYEFEGQFLWIVGEDSETKVAVKGRPGAKLFKKK